MNGDVIIPIFLFGGTAAVLWKYFDSRHKERMSMIEKGINPANMKSPALTQFLQVNPLSSLKWGLLIGFVGLGLFVAAILDRAYYMHDSVYPASMMIAGGLGLVLFYILASRRLKKDE